MHLILIHLDRSSKGEACVGHRHDGAPRTCKEHGRQTAQSFLLARDGSAQGKAAPSILAALPCMRIQCASSEGMPCSEHGISSPHMILSWHELFPHLHPLQAHREQVHTTRPLSLCRCSPKGSLNI